MSYVLSRFKAVCCPFGLGYSSAPLLALGYMLTHGLVFPFTGGGTVLLRRRLYPTTERWAYCGLGRPGEATIKNMLGFGHAAGQAYQYTAATVLGNGFISTLREPVRIDFDDQGDRIVPPLPMHPLHVTAAAIAGGKFRVAFEYSRFGQGGYPTDFQVFGGSTPATVDYNTPLVDSVTGLATVAFKAQSPRYVFTSPAYGDGVDRVFAARARNSSGVPELNTYTTATKRAVADAPSAAVPTVVKMRRS